MNSIRFFVLFVVCVEMSTGFRMRNNRKVSLPENIADLHKAIRRASTHNARAPTPDDEASAAAAAAAAAGSNIPFVNSDAAAAPETASADEKDSIKKAVKKYRDNYRKMMSGYDMRPQYLNVNMTAASIAAAGGGSMDVTSDEVIFNYVESFQKKDLLDKLENPNIPQIEKLRLLGENKFLFDEW